MTTQATNTLKHITSSLHEEETGPIKTYKTHYRCVHYDDLFLNKGL